MSRDWHALYALQDRVLRLLANVDHDFYLTGGTALGRGYYGHRYSEDLDFFVNDAQNFELWRDRCLEVLRQGAAQTGERFEVVLREPRFGRAVLHGSEPLKLEFVNDVPCRIGVPWRHAELGRLDTKENILANKVSALVDRAAPKDVADIFWLCCRDRLDILAAIEGADGKAAGIFPPVVARALDRALSRGMPDVFWIAAPAEEEFRRGIATLIGRIMSAGESP
jgi:hypothetical protein